MIADVSASAPPIVLLVGFIAFICGAGVHAAFRRPRTPVGRRYVQPRSDVDRSR